MNYRYCLGITDTVWELQILSGNTDTVWEYGYQQHFPTLNGNPIRLHNDGAQSNCKMMKLRQSQPI